MLIRLWLTQNEVVNEIGMIEMPHEWIYDINGKSLTCLSKYKASRAYKNYNKAKGKIFYKAAIFNFNQ